jgi:hypothetical protein
VKITPFDPDRKLILIQAIIWGPLGQRICRMALDCAATMTLVVPDVLDGLGYNPRDGIEITEVITPLDIQKGYDIPVQKFRSLGFEFENFVVNAQDLHPQAGIEGLVGLNFLRNFNYEVRSKDGLIRMELA